MRLLYFTIVFMLLYNPSLAQPVLVLEGPPEGNLDITPYTWFYEDLSGEEQPLEAIRTKEFRPFEEKRDERSSFSDLTRMITWLRFSIKNNHPTDTLKVYHTSWDHNEISVYRNGILINHLGLNVTAGMGKESQPRRPYRSETLLVIPPGEQYLYHIRVMNYVLAVTPIISVLSGPLANLESNYEELIATRPLMIFLCTLLGALIFMHLYALYSYLLSRDKTFLYYALYTVMAVILSLHNIDIRFGLGWFYPFYTIINPYFPGPFHPSLLTLFYGLFIGHILNLKQNFPFVWKMILVLFFVLSLQQLMAVTESLLGKPLFSNNWIYLLALLPASLTTLLLIAATYLSQSPLRKYLLAGMFGLLCLGLFPIMFNFSMINLPPAANIIVNHIAFWVICGLALESLCFATALAYRGRLTEVERNHLQEQYTRELETQLAHRSREIEEKVQQLEAQRIHQLELSFEQRLAETEMGALRAQMNPHFIFNCLNSIKLYATENEAGKAAEYLTKFSRLIRLVLENSRSEKVTLQNELEALRLYLEMEAMRFKDKLRFTLTIEESIDADFVEIPPLLIQPYVENAIWHGLMHKEEGGTVSLRLEQPEDNLLRIIIADDGIGREQAAKLKSKSATPRKSFGMAVTSERIALINQLYQTETRVQILDLIDALGRPSGTEVRLEIPI